MINLLLEFIGLCDRNKITPSEEEIDFFLTTVDNQKNIKAYRFREGFIYYCFYYWEHRTTKINILDAQIQMIKSVKPEVWC